MISTKYKRKREERRLRSLARIVLASCILVACTMLGTLSIKLFLTGTFFKGVENVSANIEKVKVNIPTLTVEMTQSLLETGFKLFQSSIKEEENTLIAPYTTLMALGMLENGAANETLDEMQQLLGDYTISELNGAYAALNEKFKDYIGLNCNVKNSIWLKRYEALLPKDYFLKVNATYYGADIFMADFSKDNTLNKMNEWLKTSTEGKNVNPIEQLDENTAIYLLSSLVFKGNWQKPYESSDVLGGDFKLTNGEKKTVKYMYSKENYLESDEVEGFVKEYTGNSCSFVAIRPIDGKDIYAYAKSLEVADFKKIIHSKSTQKAIVALPKFTYESKRSLDASLKAAGIAAAFNEADADFSKVFDNAEEKLYLSEVIQKNYIQVDEAGTNSSQSTNKTGATAQVEEEVQKSMIFNSPFLYAVIDNETKLPLLIGVMAEPE